MVQLFETSLSSARAMPGGDASAALSSTIEAQPLAGSMSPANPGLGKGKVSRERDVGVEAAFGLVGGWCGNIVATRHMGDGASTSHP